MWIQTGVTVRKRLSWVVTTVTLTFDLWPWSFAWTLLWSLVITPENFMMMRWWEHGQKGVTDGQTDRQTDRQTEDTICRAAWSQLKTIGHLFYDTLSFVHHFNAIGKFKLKLQSGNAQFGSKSMIFCAVWARNYMDDPEKQKGTSSMHLQALCIIWYPLVNSNWSYSPETPNLGQIRRFLEPCDLEIWRMTLKNNRPPLLSNIKLCVSFHHHIWIETGVTVRKPLSWVVTSVTLTFDLWPWPFAWTWKFHDDTMMWT